MDSWSVEPLAKGLDRGGFGCGQAALDDFLKKYAGQYAKRKRGTTYVAVVPSAARVLGYYTLAPSHIAFADAPPELVRGLPKHPVPSLLLARLAVDRSECGKGLGKFLLMDAFDRCLRVAREVAFRAVEVEAMDDAAAAFYGKFGFLAFPLKPRHLALPLGTIEEVLGG